MHVGRLVDNGKAVTEVIETATATRHSRNFLFIFDS
jgi:hypothetical protein